MKTDAIAAPDGSWLRFSSSRGRHLLITAYSRLFDLPESWAAPGGGLVPEALPAIGALSLPGDQEVSLDAVPLPPARSLSLNVSSSCNLGCGYCYAGQGGFGGNQKGSMTWPVARAAVDRLLAGTPFGERCSIGFLGGEPFINRGLIRQVVEYAAARAQDQGIRLGFAVTTNGTLLRSEDHALLREHAFAVTVSVDGGREEQNRQRPFAGGKNDSYAAVAAGVGPLLADPGLTRIAARATVISGSADLEAAFDGILALGFHEAGFSPLRVSMGGTPAFGDADWPGYYEGLRGLALAEAERMRNGLGIRLTNFAIALRQIHRGWSAPYPCGAGGGYFSVAADGDWYACHRAVGDAAYRLGDNSGLDSRARETFLRERHVHAQSDCTRCWARYLCSGGCHQEAKRRTAESCDFIRSWLAFCLEQYCELSLDAPAWFAGTDPLSEGTEHGRQR